MGDTPMPAGGVENVGQVVDEIGVEIGVRFLEHFSEQLYSSPHKAFEELISNAWDAGARSVYVEFPDDLAADDAAIMVLDDGSSMDAQGLHDLWKVAYSPKEHAREAHGRPVIGKFGIGKLATYVLANQLTYICQSVDGVIRVVTMDYGRFDPTKNELIEKLSLNLREASLDEVERAIGGNPSTDNMLECIRNGVPAAAREHWDDEYRAAQLDQPPASGCWTLAVLTQLKPQGQAIKRGIIRRMLATSLPFGSDLSIVVNGESLGSSKLDKEILKEWVVGPELEISTLTVSPELGSEDNAENEEIEITSGADPDPYIEIPGIGRVTGTVKIFFDNISGGKSEQLGASNGYFVNVLGRVVNHDPSFGEKDLSHSVWARFRMTVRADGLDSSLAVNREQFFQNREIRVFRTFLRRVFNFARVHYDDIVNSAWSEPGENLVNSWGTLPLRPLRDVVDRNLGRQEDLLSLFDSGGIDDREKAQIEWRDETNEDVRGVLRRVDFEESSPDAGMATYRLNDRTLAINSLHPFVQEHYSTNEEKRAVRNFALVEFMVDVQALDLGIDPHQVDQLRIYRDRMARLIAQVDRRSGVNIARILVNVATYKDPKAFEIIVGDALDFLGFTVERMGKPGQPEGVARAYPTPSPQAGELLYSFTYDAKSSQSGRVKTGNVGVAGLARHRGDHNCDHTLVVAPEFEQGALETECTANQVTPIVAADLGRMLQITASHGAIPLTKLLELFRFYKPAETASWVQELDEWVKENQNLTFDIFIEALKQIEDDIPDVVASAQIAEKCRAIMQSRVTSDDVVFLARGLQVLVPELIRVEGNDVIVSALPGMIADAITKQIQSLYDEGPLEFNS